MVWLRAKLYTVCCTCSWEGSILFPNVWKVILLSKKIMVWLSCFGMNVGSFFVEAQIMWSIKLLIRLLLYLAEPIREYMYERNTHAEKKRKIPMPCRILCDLSRDRWNPDDVFSEKDFFCSQLCPMTWLVSISFSAMWWMNSLKSTAELGKQH